MSKELAVFDSLKADITQLVAPGHLIRVIDFKTSDEAIKARAQVKALMKQVEDARDGLVRPLNEKVKATNEYARGIQNPLQQVDAHLKSQIDAFAIEQEKIKQAELRKIEAERREADRKAKEAADALAFEREAARQADLTRIREEAQEAEDMFGSKVDTAAQIREAEIAAERERLEIEARFEREKAERDAIAAQARFDASQNQIKGVRKNWKVRVVDINLVPKEFLIVELNEKMALASARAGNTKIAGLEFYQETSVSNGQNTYVPRKALEAE